MHRFFFPVPCNSGEGGSGGTGGGAAGGTGGAGAGSAGGTPWFASLPEDVRGFAEAKGWKGPEDAVKSYQNAEKLLGVPREKLIRLPDKDDAPEWSDVFSKLGRPENADGYQVEIPKEIGDEKFAAWAKGLFHEAGLSKKQGEKIASAWNAKALEAMKAQEQADNDASHQQFEKLKQEWGAAFEAKVRAKNELLKVAGVTDEQHLEMEKAMGVDGLAKFVDSLITKFGIKLGEHQFHGGGGGNNFGNLTPAGAEAKKNMLLGDPGFRQKYIDGDVGAREEIAKLEEAIWKAKQGG